MKYRLKFRTFAIIAVLSLLIVVTQVSNVSAADQTPFTFASFGDAHVSDDFASSRGNMK